MDFKKLFIIGIAVGVVVNVIDFVVQGNLLAEMYASNPVFRNTEAEGFIPWLVTGDVVAAFVFAWFYLMLGHAYTGIAGGRASASSPASSLFSRSSTSCI